ncbi:MAG TPA: SDR family oxidoreductase [Pyrinomonadaceae bacterium]|nr:SDR family oxidoreductase [Pyrinomonadaceae bacterium]
MKVLIFGGAGMLGHKLVQVLGEHFDVSYTLRSGFESVVRFGILPQAKCIENVDVSSSSSINAVIEAQRPEVVINAVGVIKQKPSASDVIATLETNSIFPQRLAALSAELGFRLITISTDCVFSGSRGMYREQDVPDALDLYGQSKHWGEVSGKNCLTLRTSIIGRELSSGHSLIEWFLGNEDQTVKGFRKAIYSGFPTIVFADIIKRLITEFPELHGLYHVSSEPINKFDLLELVRDAYERNIAIESDESFVIDRSLDSSLFRSATGFAPITWPEMVKLMAGDRTPYAQWK